MRLTEVSIRNMEQFSATSTHYSLDLPPLQEDIDRNTYELFDRDIDVPTDEYGLDQAIDDEFLVPFKPISVPLRFPRDGIDYAGLSDDEKAQWDLLDWDEFVQNTGHVESGAINSWLFNTDTVDKGLEVLMTKGCLDAAGDRLGKSIIFARNHKHEIHPGSI